MTPEMIESLKRHAMRDPYPKCDRTKIYRRPCGPCPSMRPHDPESAEIERAVRAGEMSGIAWVFPCAWRRRKICHGIAKNSSGHREDAVGEAEMIDLRKIDALIAEHIFEWSHIEKTRWYDHENKYERGLPFFSEEIFDAWMICQHFDEITIERLKNDIRGGQTWACRIGPDGEAWKVADSASYAICLAALAWKKVEIPK